MNRADVPAFAGVAKGGYGLPVELVADRPDRGHALLFDLPDNRPHLLGKDVGGLPVLPTQDLFAVFTQLLPAPNSSLQGIFGAGADLPALMLGEGGQQMDHQLVGVGIVDGLELHPALHQVGNEGHVAAQAVELGNDERSLLLTALGQGGQQLGAFVFLTALDLGVVGADGVVLPLGEQAHGFLLGVESQTAFALLVGGDPVVGDGCFHGDKIGKTGVFVLM